MFSWLENSPLPKYRFLVRDVNSLCSSDCERLTTSRIRIAAQSAKELGMKSLWRNMTGIGAWVSDQVDKIDRDERSKQPKDPSLRMRDQILCFFQDEWEVDYRPFVRDEQCVEQLDQLKVAPTRRTTQAPHSLAKSSVSPSLRLRTRTARMRSSSTPSRCNCSSKSWSNSRHAHTACMLVHAEP